MPISKNDELRAARNVLMLLKKRGRWVRWDELAGVADIYDHDEFDEFMEKTAQLTGLHLEEKDGKWRIGLKERV